MTVIRDLQRWLADRRIHVRPRPGKPISPISDHPDWVQANPARIEKALTRAIALPSGGWHAVDAVESIDVTPRPYVVSGQRLVLWRHRGEILAAPESCPHMGASLAGARVREGRIVCPWHGLELGREGHGRWRMMPTYDDGVLVWVRLGTNEAPTHRPFLPRRPERFIASVLRMEAACDPSDVIANRLDPWHGAWFHSHSFADLVVYEASDDLLALRVTFRIKGPLCIQVDATFHCADPRTIVMTIVDGEGAGSVVETHATPTTPGRTAIVEATLVASDRPGFAVARRLSPVVKYFMERAARRLWVDDVAYAERRAWLRAQAGDRSQDQLY